MVDPAARLDKAASRRVPAGTNNAVGNFFRSLGEKVKQSAENSNRRVADRFKAVTGTLIRGKSGGVEAEAAQAPVEPEPELEEDAREAAEAVLAEMEPGYFERDYESVRAALSALPGLLPPGHVEDQVIARMRELQAVNEKLTTQVGEHYADFVAGMALVGEVDRELQLAHVVARNGRRYLAAANEEVANNLRVAANTRQKGHLLELLELLDRLRAVQLLKATFRASLDQGAFPAAISACVACTASLDALGALECAAEVRSVIDEALQETLERTDGALRTVCAAFTPAPYVPVFEAYLQLGPTAGPQLGDKAASCFSQEVLSSTQAVLRSYVARAMMGADPAEAAAIRGLLYPEMCLKLDLDSYRTCLRKTLELLYDLMRSHHAMINWHAAKLASLPPLAELQAAAAAAEERRANAERASASAGEGAGASTAGDTEGGEEKRFAKLFDTVDGTAGRAQLSERLLAESVADALERARRTSWDLSARRVAALLAVPAAAEPAYFMQVLAWSHLLVRAGEAFSGAEATVLRQQLARAAGRYFESVHKGCLEGLRKALNKESWKQQPAEKPDLRATLASAPPPPGSVDEEPSTASGAANGAGPAPPVAVPEPAGPPHAFARWVTRGNPFLEDKAKKKAKLEETRKALANKMKEAKLRDGDDDEDRPELKADYVDDGDDAVDKRKKQNAASAAAAASGAPMVTQASLAVLGYMDQYLKLLKALGQAAPSVFQGLCQLFECYLLFIFKTFGKQAALTGGEDITPRLRATLQRLSAPGAGSISAVTAGASLDYAIPEEAEAAAAGLTASGPPGAHGTPGAHVAPGGPGGMHPLAPEAAKATTGANFKNWMQARADAVKTGFQAIGTNVAHAAGNVAGGVGGAVGAVGGAAVTATSGAAAVLNVVSSNNLYGLRERYIASESLHAVAEELRALRPMLTAQLPPGGSTGLDDFYKRTVESVGDLREHVYRAVALLLLRLDWLPDRLANGVKWDMKEMAQGHNRWVDDTLAELRQFKAKLGCVDLTDEVQSMMWEFAIKAAGDAIVEGLSRVKRCSMEGRGAMAVDLQMLLAELGALVPKTAPRPNLRHVEVYIKAFYVPEPEMMHWVQTHREYTARQLVALIKLAAETFKWRKESLVKLLADVEAEVAM